MNAPAITLHFVLFIITSTVLYGQQVSVNGRFSTAYETACVPYTIQIQEHDDLGNVGKTYRYEEGAQETLDTFYTYTQPGTYAIIQLLAVDIDPKFDTLFITLFDPVPPVYNVFWCDDQSFLLRMEPGFYNQFRVYLPTDTMELMGPSYEQVITTSDQIEIVIEGLLENGFANCGTTNISVIPQPLPEEVSINNYQTEYLCDFNYDLTINLPPLENILLEVEISGDLSTGPELVFSPIFPANNQLKINNLHIQNSATEFCFRVNIVQPCSGARILGEWICSDIDDANNPFSAAYATFSGNNISVFFNQNNTGTYHLTRLLDDEVVSQHEQISSGFSITTFNPERKFIFELGFEAFCGSASQQIILSPPYITKQRINPNQYQITIEPAIFQLSNRENSLITVSGSSDSPEIIEDPESTSEIRLSITRGSIQGIQYRQFSTNDSIILNSNTLEVNYEFIIYIPDAFTPNNDGINDELVLFGLPSPEFKFYVYNKWGQLVKFIENSDPRWDGRSQNNEVIPGSYTYKLEFKNSQNELYSQFGSFLILK